MFLFSCLVAFSRCQFSLFAVPGGIISQNHFSSPSIRALTFSIKNSRGIEILAAEISRDESHWRKDEEDVAFECNI